MIRRIHLALFALAATISACSDTPTTPKTSVSASPVTSLGNGYPQGGHDYSMQIIGVPKDKTAPMDGNNGHRIFVQLESNNTATPGKNNGGLTKGGNDDQNQIYLCNSTNGENDVVDPRCDAWRLDGHVGDFGVIDANGTDGDGAIFGLPDPCAGVSSTDGCTPTYSVWARAKAGKGSVTITTCADETGTGFDGTDDVWCGSNGVTLSKATARKAINVTNNLLFMTITVDDTTDPQLAACIDSGPNSTDGQPDQYNIAIFDQCFENYFWNYDNNGLKVLELRFYFVQ